MPVITDVFKELQVKDDIAKTERATHFVITLHACDKQHTYDCKETCVEIKPKKR